MTGIRFLAAAEVIILVSTATHFGVRVTACPVGAKHIVCTPLHVLFRGGYAEWLFHDFSCLVRALEVSIPFGLITVVAQVASEGRLEGCVRKKFASVTQSAGSNIKGIPFRKTEGVG